MQIPSIKMLPNPRAAAGRRSSLRNGIVIAEKAAQSRNASQSTVSLLFQLNQQVVCQRPAASEMKRIWARAGELAGQTPEQTFWCSFKRTMHPRI